MTLDNEALIRLRAPSSLGLPAPSTFEQPLVRFLNDPPTWFPVFSTFPPSRYERTPAPRDASFRLQILPGSGFYTATESWIDPNDKPDPLEVEVRPRTSKTTGTVLDVGDAPLGPEKRIAGHVITIPAADNKTASRFRDDATGRVWEVIAWGKQGQLDGWMIEHPSGLICDSSGEGRPDWRNSYAVIYHEAADGAEAGIEVWDSNAKRNRLTDRTLEKVQDALRRTKEEQLVKLADALKLVPFP